MCSDFPRLDGSAEWARLPPDTQAAIGAAAIELVAAWVGLDSCNRLSDRPTPTSRAFAAADRHGYDRLLELVAEAVPAIDPDDPPVPAGIGPVCRGCGCTEDAACNPPCHWVEPDLCSACGALDGPAPAPAPSSLAELAA